MTVCPECGGPVDDPTLWLAIPAIGSPAQAYCSPRCGDLADQRTR
jgi:hypothetical protein